jgi:hypothetical protein
MTLETDSWESLTTGQRNGPEPCRELFLYSICNFLSIRCGFNFQDMLMFFGLEDGFFLCQELVLEKTFINSKATLMKEIAIFPLNYHKEQITVHRKREIKLNT